MKKNRKRFISLLLVLVFLLTGCAGDKVGEGKKIVLTNGFDKNEVFRIETASCSLPEIKVYLTNTKNQYENIYGSQIWETKLGSTTLEENVKETVLAGIALIIRGRAKLGGFTAVPYGPFIAVATLIWMFWGPSLVSVYINLLTR